MSTLEESAALRDKAAKCRRLANGMADEQTIAALRRLAESYEHQAEELDRAADTGAREIPPKPAD